MKNKFVVVEVRPGLHLRLREEDAVKMGYPIDPENNKASRPKKTKKAPAKKNPVVEKPVVLERTEVAQTEFESAVADDIETVGDVEE